MSDETTATTERRPQTRKLTRLLHRLALAQAVLVVIVVIVALPVAFRSMGTELWEKQERLLYVFPGGEAVADNDEELTADDWNFFNIAAEDLDEAAGSVTFIVSGHRVCADVCPTTHFTLYSVADDAHVRRALPPSAEFTLAPDDVVFAESIQLPVRGLPSLYPFDDYTIWLGLSGQVEENGETTQLTSSLLSRHARITTQNQLRDFTMVQPIPIDPARVQVGTDPYAFVGVQQMVFDRPVHVEILTVLLVMLVAVSAIIAVAMRQLTDLVFGIGSLVLATWGIRSVLVPNPLPVITAVDLALSVVILFVLLGLSLRATHQFHKQSELPLPRWPRRSRGRRGDEGGERE
jgi:hypothetical protein